MSPRSSTYWRSFDSVFAVLENRDDAVTRLALDWAAKENRLNEAAPELVAGYSLSAEAIDRLIEERSRPARRANLLARTPFARNLLKKGLCSKTARAAFAGAENKCVERILLAQIPLALNCRHRFHLHHFRIWLQFRRGHQKDRRQNDDHADPLISVQSFAQHQGAQQYGHHGVDIGVGGHFGNWNIFQQPGVG